MGNRYYIVYAPVIYNLMGFLGRCETPLDLIEYMTHRNPTSIDEENYLEYLSFDTHNEKKGLVEIFGLESYAIRYVANQIVGHDTKSRVVLSDGIRRTLYDIIKENGKPDGIFISSMSANFPTTVCTAIPLNFAKIPVIIGGIHISASNTDIDRYICRYVPNPTLVSQVRGACDSDVISHVLKDLKNNRLKPEYNGYKMIEDGVWGHDAIEEMPAMKPNCLDKVPIIGKKIKEKIRLNPITPYMGCPHSCNFCSISSIPKNKRKFCTRSPEDFVNELEHYRKQGADFTNRLFFFLADNLLMGGEKLEKILDKIIERKLTINYAAQISIDVAENELILDKLRRSGASHLFIGFESLDIKNLKFIEKNVVAAIEKSGKTVKQYYSDKIKKIQKFGISIHGAFILGLPYDFFNSIFDNTGHEIGKFCVKNHIGIQATPFSDLPGSKNFIESQKRGTYLFDKQGTMDYLIALCICDLTEGNRIPPESLKKSPLIVNHMTYEAINRIGASTVALKSALYMMRKAFFHPTMSGCLSLKERCNDAFLAFVAQLAVRVYYKEHANKVVSSFGGVKGSFERFYNWEKNDEVKKGFNQYVLNFIQ